MDALPQEELRLVLANLPWQDNLRFRNVSKRWNSNLREILFRLMYPAPCGSTLLCSSRLIPSLDHSWKELFNRFSSRCCGVDPAFRIFNLNGDKHIIFPKMWLDLMRNALPCPSMKFHIVDIKGGNFLISWAERHIDATLTGSCDSLFPVESVESPCLCLQKNSKITGESQRRVLCLVNPVTRSFKIFHSRVESHEGGLSTDKLIVDKQKNTLKILLVDSSLPCRIHYLCDMWSLSYYDVIRKSWSTFSFHLSRLFPDHTSTEKFRCFLYDATILGDELFFVTIDDSDSVHAIWKFSSDSGSIFPTRLADITNCTILKPGIEEHEGRIMLVGRIQNCAEFVSCVWEYDVSKNTWILLPSFLEKPRPSRINREEMPGWDLTAIFTEKQHGKEYIKLKLSTMKIWNVPWNHDPKSVVMIERRFDIHF